MWEQSKAARRRYADGAFHSRYFVGRGIDIGGKPDPLGQYVGVFSRMESVRTWDQEDGDAQLMAGVPEASVDFVHASHSLEHMVDVEVALGNWIRILKPGGYLIVTVPDEDLYELGHWPSRFNSDHKWTFAVAKATTWSPRSINVVDLARRFSNQVDVERIVQLRDFFRDALRSQNVDQTLTPVAECAIEFVWRKRPPLELRVGPGGPVLADAHLYGPTLQPWRETAGEFARDYRKAAVHTVVSAERCHALWSLARQALSLPGEFWECGVYRGGTAAMLASLMARAAGTASKPLRLFDTFAGMPDVDPAKDAHRGGDFAQTSIEHVRRAVGHESFVSLHAGRIPESFAGLEASAIALAHVDVDIYRSVLDCCEFIWPRLVPGGIMVFDDYGFPTCQGAREAVDEFFRDKPVVPLVLGSGHAIVFRSR